MKKILSIVVLIIIMIIGSSFLYKKVKEQQNFKRVELCSQSYSCKIDENDKELQHCKSLDNGKEVDVRCASWTMCLDAYKCQTNEKDFDKANCKIKQNDQIHNITCPNTYCKHAYGCEEDSSNSNVLNCRYMDYKNNEENNIKCRKNPNK